MSGPSDSFGTNRLLEGTDDPERQQLRWSGQLHPAAHPDSSFNRLRDQRFQLYDPNVNPTLPFPQEGLGLPSSQIGHADTYNPAHSSDSIQRISTMNLAPGVTTFTAAAAGDAGGGIALDAATRNGQNVGPEPWRDLGDEGNGHFANPSEPPHIIGGSDGLQVPQMPSNHGPGRPSSLAARDSYGSDIPLGVAGAGTGQVTPGRGSPYPTSSHPSQQSLGSPFPPPYQSSSGPYYPGYGPRMEPEPINVDEIADDEDDELFDPPQRRSVPSLGHDSSNDTNSRHINPTAGAAASGGMLGSIGGMFKGGNGGSGAGPSYGIVPGSAEKKRWLGGRKRAMIRALLLGFLILGGIIGGIVAGIVVHFKNNSSGSSNSSSGSGGGANSGGSNSDQSDFDKNSPEIQALMNNKNLHKVFPGMDYTPWGVQYPLCLQYPPIQNNVTQDLAVLSQLTNTVRLYGTDCNQTEMTLYAIDRLGLTDMKVWLGVWIDTNTTTNDRQLTQLYNIIDSTKDKSIFKGAIIGNEVLFRASPDIASAEATLITYIQSVRANFTQRNLNLSLATSDLGDNWNVQLTQAVDVIMSNVHPFFGGVVVDQAAAWTWSFWQSHDVSLTQGTTKQQVISEVGWPSGGGKDCGTTTGCQNGQAGAVAGIDEMNKFMSDFVCQSLSNGTEYFWFEAFDEPWKVQFNVPGQEWEDKWGLMDAARNLKAGLNIPDCGGKQAT